MKLNELKKNDYVSFIYDGGTNPGSVRYAVVQKVEGDSVFTIDIGVGEPRNFSSQKARAVSRLKENVELIKIEDIRTQLGSLAKNANESLVYQIYKSNYPNEEAYSVGKFIVVVKPVTATIDILNEDGNTKTITVKRSSGEQFSFDCVKGVLTYDIAGKKQTINNPTGEQFVSVACLAFGGQFVKK